MSSAHHNMLKKVKPNDDASRVLFEYTGEAVPDNVTHVRFHPSVVNVHYQAFKELTKLREVVFNYGLREIGNAAFYGCRSLQSINIPSTVNNIGCSAFGGCTNLRDVVLSDGLKKIKVGVFDGCTSLQSITIPLTVEEIDTYAFDSCNSLRDVVLNDGLKKIGNMSFRECTSIRSIELPSTVVEIVKNAFIFCTELSEVVIYNEEIQIGVGAFGGCTSLERFKFPSLSTRLDNIIQAGQRDIEAKMEDIPGLEWRGGELSILAISRQRRDRGPGAVETLVELDKEKLAKVKGLIVYYEMKEATTLFELALWKANLDKAKIGVNSTSRGSCCIEVPGPIKDTILQYLL